MSKVTIVLTSGTTWTVPIDCTSATVECIGPCNATAGTNFYGGNYSITNNVTLTPLQKVYINIGGYGGTLSWFNKDTNSIPTSTANGSCSGVSFNNNNRIGDIIYAGGTPGTEVVEGDAPGCSNYYMYGGAGGTAGPNGPGANGASSFAVGNNTFSGGGGGGGANGSSPGVNANNVTYYGGVGGNSFFGLGGVGQTNVQAATNGTLGAGGGGAYDTNTSSGLGTPGTGSIMPIWTDSYSKLTYGVLGGVGGYSSANASIYIPSFVPANPGSSGGAGLIVITYTPTSPPTGTYVEAITNNSLSNWKVPPGVTSLKIECIGAGSYASDIYSTIYPDNTASSGGSYASNTVTVNPNDFLKIRVGVPQYTNYQDSNTLGSTVVKTSSNTILVCATGGVSGALPNNANNVGSITFVGGVGGNNAYASTRGYSAGGGGGGAAGPGGAGKKGGNANTTTTAGRGGGGGGAGGTSSTAGANASLTVAGAGGAGPAGTGAGSAATSGVNAGAGTNGGGGGGGFSSTTATRYDGAAGGANIVSTWTTSVQNSTYGPGGGGGGSAAIVGLPPYPAGGSGGLYGGGAGGGIGAAAVTGGGLIILTYTVTAANNISSPEMTPMFFR
jgi:hypothetical protein